MATKNKAAPKKAAPKKKAAAKRSSPAVEKPGAGRPSKYRPEYDTVAREMCRIGATDKDLGRAFSVCEDTVNEWKKEYPSFAEQVAAGKSEFDNERVKIALRDRALGYEHDEEKIFCHEGVIVRAKTRKKYPPDTQAASLWLRNRDPENWRDKVDHEHAGRGGGAIPIAAVTAKLDDLTDEEAAKAYLDLVKRSR